MIDYILAAVMLTCTAYTAFRVVGLVFNVIVAKYVTNSNSIENIISKLISIAELDFGNMQKGNSYQVTTKNYCVTVEKRKNT